MERTGIDLALGGPNIENVVLLQIIERRLCDVCFRQVQMMDNDTAGRVFAQQLNILRTEKRVMSPAKASAWKMLIRSSSTA